MNLFKARGFYWLSILATVGLKFNVVLALQPAALRPATHHTSASSIPDPPPMEEPFEPSILDIALLAVFRWTFRQQQPADGPRSDLPGFDGLVQELLDFRRQYGLDEQERVSYQTMIALSGPVPWIYKQLFASAEFSPALLAWFAKHLLPFLVGDMVLTERHGSSNGDNILEIFDAPPLGGGVLVQRCRVLEGTNCKGVCVKMCKIPTQRFFADQWGVPLSMTPNFETGQCQLAFGVEPTPVELDPTLPQGCLTRFPAAPQSQPLEVQEKAAELQTLKLQAFETADVC